MSRIIDRKPDRAAPVGVAAEQTGARFRRLVVDAVVHAVDFERVWMVAMVARERRGCRRATGIHFHPTCNASTRFRRCRLTSERKRRGPSSVAWVSIWSLSSGRFSMNHCMRRLKPGNLSINGLGPEFPRRIAESGPTRERTFKGDRSPFGRDKHIVEKSVFGVPQLDVLAAEVVHGARRCRQNARRTCSRHLRRRGCPWPIPMRLPAC